jgi:hypothetical protein
MREWSYPRLTVSHMSAVATYRYLNASTLTTGTGLALQTSGGPVANPRFFRGFSPRRSPPR